MERIIHRKGLHAIAPDEIAREMAAFNSYYTDELSPEAISWHAKLARIMLHDLVAEYGLYVMTTEMVGHIYRPLAVKSTLKCRVITPSTKFPDIVWDMRNQTFVKMFGTQGVCTLIVEDLM